MAKRPRRSGGAAPRPRQRDAGRLRRSCALKHERGEHGDAKGRGGPYAALSQQLCAWHRTAYSSPSPFPPLPSGLALSSSPKRHAAAASAAGAACCASRNAATPSGPARSRRVHVRARQDASFPSRAASRAVRRVARECCRASWRARSRRVRRLAAACSPAPQARLCGGPPSTQDDSCSGGARGAAHASSLCGCCTRGALRTAHTAALTLGTRCSAAVALTLPRSFQSVLLVLGASASRPREAYELRLPVARDGVSGSGLEPAGRNAGADAARRATRVLVGALADSPDALSGSSRVQLCAERLPRADAAASFHASAMKLFVLLRSRADAAVPPGFLPKRGLRVAIHR